jgi:GT2 family glycosyltransferase
MRSCDTHRFPPAHVLVLNWNGWRDTIECLESVFRLDYPDLRVIVCDNASTDGSLDRIREWAEGRLVPQPGRSEPLRQLSWPPMPKPIAYVEYAKAAAERGGERNTVDTPLILIQTGANLGFGGGNNVGLRYLLARQESGYVWVLNNDIVVARDSLRRLVEVAESDESIGGVGATLLRYNRPDVIESTGGGTVARWQGLPRVVTATNGRGSERSATVRLDYLTGGCIVTRMSALADVGLIDERYFLYGEDVDWSLRAQARGWQLAVCPGAKVWHKGGKSVGHRSPRHDYYIVKSGLLLVHKFNPRLLPFAVGYSAYRCLLPKVIRGQWERVRAVASAYHDFLRQVRQTPPAGRGRRTSTAKPELVSPP